MKEYFISKDMKNNRKLEMSLMCWASYVLKIENLNSGKF